MKLSMTNDTEQANAIIGIYGPPKSGKTFCLATALPLGDVLHVSAPGEGNAASSLRDYPIKQVTLADYYDLMALESALLNKPIDWMGEKTDPPVARLTTQINADFVKTMKEFIGSSPAVIALDGLRSFQADIFGGQSIAFWGKDMGKGRYGDIATLTRIHFQRLAFIPGVKMLVFITQDRQVQDKSLAGMESTYREMGFEGQLSRDIVPPMCDMILPIFSASQLGESFKEWTCTINGKQETRDRYFPLTPFQGYWAGGRVGFTDETTIQADLTRIWNTFYAKKKEAVKT